jgi:hypothetical protein
MGPHGLRAWARRALATPRLGDAQDRWLCACSCRCGLVAEPPRGVRPRARFVRARAGPCFLLGLDVRRCLLAGFVRPLDAGDVFVGAVCVVIAKVADVGPAPAVADDWLDAPLPPAARLATMMAMSSGISPVSTSRRRRRPAEI